MFDFYIFQTHLCTQPRYFLAYQQIRIFLIKFSKQKITYIKFSLDFTYLLKIICPTRLYIQTFFYLARECVKSTLYPIIFVSNSTFILCKSMFIMNGTVSSTKFSSQLKLKLLLSCPPNHTKIESDINCPIIYISFLLWFHPRWKRSSYVSAYDAHNHRWMILPFELLNRNLISLTNGHVIFFYLKNLVAEMFLRV